MFELIRLFWLPVVVLALAVLLKVIVFKIEQRKRLQTFPYGLKARFLSPAEEKFFNILRKVTPHEIQVCPKVRLCDLLDHRGDRYAFNRISQKHIDFVLVNSYSWTPVAAIELDDKSHLSPSRQKRDSFINEAFQHAGLPLHRIKVKADYDTSELSKLFKLGIVESA